MKNLLVILALTLTVSVTAQSDSRKTKDKRKTHQPNLNCTVDDPIYGNKRTKHVKPSAMGSVSGAHDPHGDFVYAQYEKPPTGQVSSYNFTHGNGAQYYASATCVNTSRSNEYKRDIESYKLPDGTSKKKVRKRN